MKKNFLKVIAWVTSIAMVVLSAYLGQQIPFEEQWPLFEALRTTAAIIFAVVGAWLAIIYPERLRMSFQAIDKVTSTPTGGISKLFTPIVHSTAILCIILFVGVLAPVLKRIDMILPYVIYFRGVSYGLLVALTLWQLWTVVLSFIPADIVKSHADHEQRHQATVDGYTRNGSFLSRSHRDQGTPN